jgi:DNA repair exonuclease SbcCD nuclease subunit
VPVYSGHYHLPQKLLRSGDADAIEYVGSPYQLSFGEEQKDDTSTVEIDS